jgi:L,D-transpeptidase catalytic domain
VEKYLHRSVIISALLLSLAAFVGASWARSAASCDTRRSDAGKTVSGVLRTIGPRAEARLKPYFESAGVAYPPRQIALIGLKDEMQLELWAEKDNGWVHIRTYEILAASGDVGPKQKRGDHQVPEGIYRVTSLNPNSRFHLSMKIDYPNDFDLEKARDDNRTGLGGDIFIHGDAKSVGCIAIGDKAIEELFVLVAETGVDNTTVVIAPNDLRRWKPWLDAGQKYPSWLPELYNSISQEMAKFREKPGA